VVTVRQVVLDDADAIGSIWLEAFRVGYRGIVPDEAIARCTDEEAKTYWRTVLADPERAYFVVVADVPGDAVVGFAQAGPCEPDEPGYDQELWKLYIREAHHRRGIGRMLMSAMAERLAARGMSSMMLRAFVGNQARGFYERMGGQFLRTEPYEILGAQVPSELDGWPDLSLLCSAGAVSSLIPDGSGPSAPAPAPWPRDAPRDAPHRTPGAGPAPAP
jgi:ribosomal protein S18 acetylase RimI-like enzyme